MFRILLLILSVGFLSSDIGAAAAASDVREKLALTGTFRVAFVDPVKDEKALLALARAHTKSEAADKLEVGFKELMEDYEAEQALKRAGTIAPIVGNYGLYHKE